MTHTTLTAPKLSPADLDRLKLLALWPMEDALRASGDALLAHPQLLLGGLIQASRHTDCYFVRITAAGRALLAALDAEASEEG